MTTTLGINGFGRIGRTTLASISEYSRNDVVVSKINAPGPIETNAHLLRYDSVHGRFAAKVEVKENSLDLGRGPIEVSSSYNAADLDWSGCDVVLECTGKFTTYDKALTHVKNGAKSVLISAPAKNVDRTVIFGVNEHQITGKEQILSNGSCTTNCLAPIAKVLNDEYGIEEGLMTTVHATTATQFTVDGPSKKDFRGGRSSLLNIMPASTGAAKAVTKVIPSLEGKLTGMAFRVPTANVSVVDLTVKLKKETSYDEIKKIMKNASKGYLKNILGYCDEPVVSQDFIGDIRTSIFDAGAGMELNSRFYKIISWYDNECGYSNKLIDLASHISKL